MRTVLLSPINDFQNYTKSKTLPELRHLYSQISKKDEKQIWWRNPPRVTQNQLLSTEEVLSTLQKAISEKNRAK